MTEQEKAEYRRAWRKRNPDKVRAWFRRWASKNAERLREKKKAWMEANKERLKVRMAAHRKAWRDRNKEAEKKSKKAWARRNSHYCNSFLARRRARKLMATPKWANEFFIEEIYDLARRRTDCLGVKHHVDHVVPLQSKIVCGLHCEANLRVIPARTNIRKGNREWPDMPEPLRNDERRITRAP